MSMPRRTILVAAVALGMLGPEAVASQILNADSLGIVQAVVATRSGWISKEIPFDSCSVYEHAAKPSDLGELFPRVALDHVEDPCRTRERSYPLIVIDGIEESGALVIVSVRVNGSEYVHREEFTVRQRLAPARGWFVSEVRTSGFLRLHRPNQNPNERGGSRSGARGELDEG